IKVEDFFPGGGLRRGARITPPSGGAECPPECTTQATLHAAVRQACGAPVSTVTGGDRGHRREECADSTQGLVRSGLHGSARLSAPLRRGAAEAAARLSHREPRPARF